MEDSDTVDREKTSKAELVEQEEKFDPKADQELRSQLGVIDQQYVPQTNIPTRIHLVGSGSIGKLVAHSLRSIPNPPPVTLILHRYRLLQTWEKSRKAITVADGEYVDSKVGYDVELNRPSYRAHEVSLDNSSQSVYKIADETYTKPHEAAKMIAMREAEEMDPPPPENGPGTDISAHDGAYAMSDEPIHNLIVATKAIRTINALAGLRHRLSRESTICFLQNGMGIIDDVNEQLFPDEATRPNYLFGIVTHGANVPPAKAEEDPFYVVHAGHGTIALGAVPRQSLAARATGAVKPSGPGTDNEGKIEPESAEEWAPSARYMLRTLTRCPVLCAVGFTPIELLQQQLEKLAVNCILNPLTVLLDNRNGSILYNFALTRTMRLMLAEISLVIRSLPELKGIPNVPFRFSAERLETIVVGVANKTANNISSMLADVRAGRRTEIRYINGYIIKRGEEMGIKCVVNYAIMQTVVGKCLMTQREYQDEVPMEGSRLRAVNRE